ncbi:Lrp/AsnC family transcriptional regulator [Aeromicrobium sp. P5_D10]
MASQKHQLDAQSKRIIELLQADGRRSFTDIGRLIGLSEAAVRQRYQRMTEAGLLEITAVTDPMQLGFNRQAMIGINVSGDIDAIADQIAALEAVDYLLITAGSFDLLAEVICEDDSSLIDLINTQIRSIDGVQTTQTFMYLRLVKQFYQWGTR